MKSNRNRTRMTFQLESLEGRLALSGVSGVVEDGLHHHRGGRTAEVHTLRRGADDAANHDANDDKGGAASGTHRRRGGHNASGDKGGVKVLRHGADDAANHNANDNKGGAASAPKHRRGADDPIGHK